MYQDVIHGDISMHAVDPKTLPHEIVSQLQQAPTQRVVLAVGEATGHAHVLTSDAPIGYVRVSAEIAYVLLEKAGLLGHTGTAPGEGHGTRTMAPGYYVVPTEREYDPTLYQRPVTD